MTPMLKMCSCYLVFYRFLLNSGPAHNIVRLNVLTLFWLNFRHKLKQTFNVHVMFLGGSKLRSFRQVISYMYVLYNLHEQHNGIENIES